MATDLRRRAASSPARSHARSTGSDAPPGATKSANVPTATPTNSASGATTPASATNTEKKDAAPRARRQASAASIAAATSPNTAPANDDAATRSSAEPARRDGVCSSNAAGAVSVVMILVRERMASIVHLEQAIQRQVCVPLRRRQARVTEHFLDGPEIGAALEHVRRTRVSERMRVKIRSAGAERAVTMGELLNPADSDSTATPSDEQRRRIEPARLGVGERVAHA